MFAYVFNLHFKEIIVGPPLGVKVSHPSQMIIACVIS